MSLLPLLWGGVQQQGDGESSSPTLRGRRGNYGGWHCKRVKDNGKVGGQWVVGGEETGTHGRSYYWSAVVSSARPFAKISQLSNTNTYQEETNSTDLQKFLWDLFELFQPLFRHAGVSSTYPCSNSSSSSNTRSYTRWRIPSSYMIYEVFPKLQRLEERKHKICACTHAAAQWLGHDGTMSNS